MHAAPHPDPQFVNEVERAFMLSVIFRPDDKGAMVPVHEVCGTRRNVFWNRFGNFLHEGRLVRN